MEIIKVEIKPSTQPSELLELVNSQKVSDITNVAVVLTLPDFVTVDWSSNRIVHPIPGQPPTHLYGLTRTGDAGRVLLTHRSLTIEELKYLKSKLD